MNYVNIPHSEHSVGSLWMVFVSVLRRKWLCTDRSPLKSLFWRARVLNQCWTRTNQSPSARVRWSTAGLWPLRTGTNRFTLIWTHTHTLSQDWSLSAVCVSLQTAVMVRVGTEEEDEEDEKPSSREQDVSYELSNSKHSTLMSGGHWALFSIKLLPERLDWKESVQTPSPYCSVYRKLEPLTLLVFETF